MPNDKNQGAAKKASASKAKAKTSAAKKPAAKKPAAKKKTAAGAGGAKSAAKKPAAGTKPKSKAKAKAKAKASSSRSRASQSHTLSDMSAALSGYFDTMKTRLKDWGIEIDTLKAKADETGTEARSEFMKRLDVLRELQQEASTRVRHVMDATEPAWKDLSKGIERAVKDLRNALETNPKQRKK